MWTPPTLMPALMCGLRADVLEPPQDNVIVIEQGVFAASGGYAIYTLDEYLYIDPTIFGINGRDRAAPYTDGQAVFVYLIVNDATQKIEGLLSPAYDYGGVIVPAGRTLLRKHPLALCWRDVWGGFPDFHFSGIQNPRLDFGIFSTVPEFQVSFAGNSETPAGIDLSALVPAMGAARFVHLTWALYSTIPASAYLGWGPGVMRELVTVAADGSGSRRGETEMRCTSGGTLAYRVSDARATFVLWVRGYTCTEVTT